MFKMTVKQKTHRRQLETAKCDALLIFQFDFYNYNLTDKYFKVQTLSTAYPQTHCLQPPV